MTLDIQQLRSLRQKILTVLILYTQTDKRFYRRLQAKVTYAIVTPDSNRR